MHSVFCQHSAVYLDGNPITCTFVCPIFHQSTFPTTNCHFFPLATTLRTAMPSLLWAKLLFGIAFSNRKLSWHLSWQRQILKCQQFPSTFHGLWRWFPWNTFLLLVVTWKWGDFFSFVPLLWHVALKWQCSYFQSVNTHCWCPFTFWHF